MSEAIGMLGQTLAQAGEDQRGFVLMVGLALAVGVFLFISSRSQRRERAKKQSMIDSMKKNDRVMTIGGVIGTVVSVKDNEVVVKVDEATNTRMTFLKRSIQQVITGDEELKLNQR